MAWAGMVRVRAGVGGMGKSAVTSVVSPESSSCAPPAGWATRVVSSATSIATVETGRILGRVAESSSGDDASAGADIGAPQLGHAIAVPGARAVRRPQRAHAISCILLLQRMKAGKRARPWCLRSLPSSDTSRDRRVYAQLGPGARPGGGGEVWRYWVFRGPISA